MLIGGKGMENMRVVLPSPHLSATLWQANIGDMPLDQKSPVHREVGFPRWHGHPHTQTHNIPTSCIVD